MSLLLTAHLHALHGPGVPGRLYGEVPLLVLVLAALAQDRLRVRHEALHHPARPRHQLPPGTCNIKMFNNFKKYFVTSKNIKVSPDVCLQTQIVHNFTFQSAVQVMGHKCQPSALLGNIQNS